MLYNRTPSSTSDENIIRPRNYTANFPSTIRRAHQTPLESLLTCRVQLLRSVGLPTLSYHSSSILKDAYRQPSTSGASPRLVPQYRLSASSALLLCPPASCLTFTGYCSQENQHWSHQGVYVRRQFLSVFRA